MELDTTKLSQAGSRKLTPHDNCIVLDIGTGTFPRLVELRLPGVDGARQSALWDGSLDLAVDDIVIADEYAGQTIWRISAMGGGDSGAGKVRVSKVWESDFENEILTIDATGQTVIQPAVDSTTAFQILDADGGTPVINADTVDEGIGIRTDTLNYTLQGSTIKPAVHILQSSSSLTGGIITTRISNTANLGPQNNFARARVGPAALQNNDRIGTFAFQGFDDTDYNTSAVFSARVDGAVAANTVPMALLFEVSATNSTGLTEGLRIASSGRIGVNNITSPLAQIHIDQASTTAAIPVAYFDQADVSEEMFEFNTTIGTGNAIEAKGLKLLTPTHFVKTTIPGGLTRYFPVGTIDTVGPKFTRSSTLTTRGLGANPDIYAFGFYRASSTDANLTQASTTQAHGTANLSYAAHAFVVTGGAGSVDTGVVGLRVNGTSINDQGTRTTSDTETIIADITAVALDEYAESGKKWLGTYTYELFTVSGSPTTFSLDFNFGRAKYDDWFNTDFTITDIESVGFAGANDSNFDIKLIHHQATGWTYAATGFSPVTAANTVASLVGDHSTDDQLGSSQHMAWKRDDLSEAIDGADGEGFLVFVSSSANNAIEYLNIHIGVVF